RQIVNHSIKKVDLGTPLPRGPRGYRGSQGPQGFQGQQGPPGGFSASNVVQVNGPTAALAPSGGTGSSLATCPPGAVAIGGGWAGESNPPVDSPVGYNTRYATAWGVIMVNWAVISANFHAFVVCAVSGAPAAQQTQRAAAMKTWAHDIAATRSAVARMQSA